MLSGLCGAQASQVIHYLSGLTALRQAARAPYAVNEARTRRGGEGLEGSPCEYIPSRCAFSRSLRKALCSTNSGVQRPEAHMPTEKGCAGVYQAHLPRHVYFVARSRRCPPRDSCALGCHKRNSTRELWLCRVISIGSRDFHRPNIEARSHLLHRCIARIPLAEMSRDHANSSRVESNPSRRPRD